MSELLINREGFWASASNTTLPSVPLSTPWKNRSTFLRALDKVEAKAVTNAYRGVSVCRVCDKPNGSAEYLLKIESNTWVWPSGYRHYISEHQVRPSLAFEEFITYAGRSKI